MTGTIAAILGVKDECELIAASIAHLRRIGVDHVCVVDYGSRDGTIDIVRAECAAGDTSLVHVDPDVVVDYATSSAHDLALARATGAEWVLVLDADEFWLPASGTLRGCASLREADIVTAERFNVALTHGGLLMPEAPGPSVYDRLHLFTRRVSHFRQFIETHPWEPFITIAPGQKALGRLAHVAAIAPGGHDLWPAQPTSRRLAATDVIVAHVAFSTWPRFARKVANIRAEIVRHPKLFEGDYAWHWRRWAGMSALELRREFDRQVASPRRLRTWRYDGYLRTAAEALAGPLPAAAPAAAPAELRFFEAAWRALPTAAGVQP